MTRPLKPWTVASTRTVFADPPHIEVAADDVMLPDGSVVKGYYRINSRPSCAVVATDVSGRFLMIRQYKHGAGKICLTFPGGRLEAGETIAETAKRELREETGYEAAAWRSLGDFPIHANQHVGIVSIFRATGAWRAGPADAGDLEEMELVFLTADEARAALASGDIGLLGDAAALALAAYDEERR